LKLYNLRKVREREGLSRRELSEKSGLSLSTVYRIENLTSDARQSTVEKLGRVLGNVSAEELAFPDVHTNPTTEAQPATGEWEEDQIKSPEEDPTQQSIPSHEDIIKRLDRIISLLERMQETQFLSTLTPLISRTESAWPLLALMEADKVLDRDEEHPTKAEEVSSHFWKRLREGDPRRVIRDKLLEELQSESAGRR
jgi:transcriptional regulator with XRE-family HTH domain